MITELKSAMGSIIPHANYIDAGSLGIRNIDATTRLDPSIAERLTHINNTVDALSRAQGTAFDVHQSMLRAYKDAEAKRDRYIAEYEEAHHARPDADVMANLDREVLTAKASADSADKAVVLATARSSGSRQALNASIKYLNGLTRSGKTVKLAKLPKVTGVSGRVVAEQRDVLRALDEERYDVEHALVPVQDAVDAIKTRVRLLAESGRPRISVTHRGADIDVPKADTFLLSPGADGPVPITFPDAMAFTVWLHEDKLVERAEQVVRQRYGADVVSLSTAERAQRIASLDKREMDATLMEVQAVIEAWRAGDYNVGLRADTPARAVLGIA